MGWQYTPITGVLFFVAIIACIIFWVLLFYYLHLIDPDYQAYLEHKRQVETLRGEVNTWMIHESTGTLMTPRESWTYITLKGKGLRVVYASQLSQAPLLATATNV